MYTGIQVILITKKQANNSLNHILIRNIIDNTIRIKNKNILLIYCFSSFKKILRWYLDDNFSINNDIKIIIIDRPSQQAFAKYLQKNFYKSAKIVNLHIYGSIAPDADSILASNLIAHSIPKKYHLKCLFYKGILSDNILPIYKKAHIIDCIIQPIMWACIGNHVLKKNISKEQAENFCNTIINFAKEFNAFIFISLNITSAVLASFIKQQLSNNVCCYIFDFSISKNLDYYYTFLDNAEYIVHFGVDVSMISKLMALNKYLYVLLTDKEREKYHLFCRDIIEKNVFLCHKQIPSPQKKSRSINNIDEIINNFISQN